MGARAAVDVKPVVIGPRDAETQSFIVFVGLAREVEAQAFPLMEKHARGNFDLTEFDKEDMVIVGPPD